MIERKLRVLIVESSADIRKRLKDFPDNRTVEILYTSTAENAFDLISMEKPDTIIWGKEWNAKNASKLTELRKENNPFSLIVLSDYTEEDYKNMDNYIRPYAFLNKQQEFKELAKLILQPTASKPPSADFRNYAQTCSDMFLRDPLF
ncbi:MAG: hypothetical protein JWQ09_3819 [Segetibacter sp.]|nr:hypothetical protein [Segetibacter sp.]